MSFRAMLVCEESLSLKISPRKRIFQQNQEMKRNTQKLFFLWPGPKKLNKIFNFDFSVWRLFLKKEDICKFSNFFLFLKKALHAGLGLRSLVLVRIASFFTKKREWYFFLFKRVNRSFVKSFQNESLFLLFW